MIKMTDIGKYSIPRGKGFENEGSDVTYDYNYDILEASDGCENAEILALANRQNKVDANNKTRASIQSDNGHSTAHKMTAEEKADKKVQRQTNKELIALLASKGLTADDLRSM